MFFIPGLCSSVAVALVWKSVYNTDFGILNSIITQIGFQPVKWLTDKHVVMISMIIQSVWFGIGSGMVMYIAAIKAVPRDYYEAATIDGAKSGAVFFRITLPLISSTTMYLLITTVMSCMQDFARYKLMTNGGPNGASTTVTLYIYQLAFKYTEYGYGYATAMAWVLGIIIVALIGLIFKSSKWWVHYND